MRYLAPTLLLLFLWGCQSPKAKDGERRTVTPVFTGPRITLACELRYYVVGELNEPSSLPLIDGQDVDDLDRPVGLLERPRADMRWGVRGFVLKIIQPANESGKILTAHWDMDGSDPFKICEPGKRYIVDVPPELINDTRFKLCW